jgi:Tol biopolymer transport system component
MVVHMVVAGIGITAALSLGALLCGRSVPSEGQIAFITPDDVRGEIRIIDVRTRIICPVVSLIDLDQITWSATGTLALTIRHGENSRIAMIDPQSRDVRQLTFSSSFDTNPAWSPDGQWLAFQSSDASGAYVYVTNLSGSNVRQLTNDPAFDGDPSWSPDGQQIVFRSSRSGNTDLYVMDVQGNNIQQLTDNQAWEEHPSWSPDGKYIAFASYLLTNWDLYLFEVATGEIRRLTDSSARDRFPTWSPDSRRIAFESNRDGPVSIYVLNLDDGNLTLIARGFYSTYFLFGL